MSVHVGRNRPASLLPNISKLAAMRSILGPPCRSEAANSDNRTSYCKASGVLFPSRYAQCPYQVNFLVYQSHLLEPCYYRSNVL